MQHRIYPHCSNKYSCLWQVIAACWTTESNMCWMQTRDSHIRRVSLDSRSNARMQSIELWKRNSKQSKLKLYATGAVQSFKHRNVISDRIGVRGGKGWESNVPKWQVNVILFFFILAHIAESYPLKRRKCALRWKESRKQKKE